MNDFRFDIFLSHNSADKGVVRRFAHGRHQKVRAQGMLAGYLRDLGRIDNAERVYRPGEERER